MKTARSDFDIGSIYWLPALNKIPREHLYATVHIDSGCFDHPIVILWVNPQKTEAIILTVRIANTSSALIQLLVLTFCRSLPLEEKTSSSDIPAILALDPTTSQYTPATLTPTTALGCSSKTTPGFGAIAM
jgi:hypothetical protein